MDRYDEDRSDEDRCGENHRDEDCCDEVHYNEDPYEFVMMILMGMHRHV